MNIHLEHLDPPQRHKHYGRNLVIALLASGSVLVVELWASYITGSLALLSDAGHLLVDISGLLMAYVALRMASRPATPQATYGFFRAEVLAAAFNGILLIGVAAFISYRAWGRLQDPLPELDGVVVLVVAIIGLLANLLAAFILHRDAQENINTRGAFLNVMGDALASIGVIISAVLVIWTGDTVWDTVVSFVVAAIIIYSAIGLMRSAIHILLEVAPSHLDLHEIKRQVEALSGVVNVHDLHVWTLTPGRYSATFHVSIDRDRSSDFHVIIKDIENLLSERFDLTHCTIQVEPEGEDAVSDRFDPVSGEMPERE